MHSSSLAWVSTWSQCSPWPAQQQRPSHDCRMLVSRPMVKSSQIAKPPHCYRPWQLPVPATLLFSKLQIAQSGYHLQNTGIYLIGKIGQQCIVPLNPASFRPARDSCCLEPYTSSRESCITFVRKERHLKTRTRGKRLTTIRHITATDNSLGVEATLTGLYGWCHLEVTCQLTRSSGVTLPLS